MPGKSCNGRSARSRLGVAVVGAGLIAQEEHLPGWLSVPEACVRWLVEPDRARCAQVAQRFGIPHTAATLDPVLTDPEVAVVDICAPAALHAPMALAALQAGKHVLCEKPMALTGAEAAQMVAQARTARRKLMIGHHLRFDPMALALHRALEAWGRGEFHAARAQWLRMRRVPARDTFTQRRLAGGGALLDLGVHMIDLAWWMAGCPAPRYASATLSDRLLRREDVQGEWGQWDPRRIDVEEFAWGQVRFEHGLVISLEISWLALTAREEFQQVEWFGDRWGAQWPSGRLFAHRRGRPWSVQLAPQGPGRPHRTLIRQFARCVLEDAPEPVPPEQIALVTAVVEALYRSARLGKEVPVENPFGSKWCQG